MSNNTEVDKKDRYEFRFEMHLIGRSFDAFDEVSDDTEAFFMRDDFVVVGARSVDDDFWSFVFLLER